MEIRISEKEITAGVVSYLNSRGFNLDANNVKIDYTVGRKPAGISAVLLEGDSIAEVKTKPAAKLTGQGDTSGAAVADSATTAAPEPELVQEPEPGPEPELDPEVPTETANEGTSLFK